LLTYLRRESRLMFLPLAFASQATIARLRAALSALDTFAALAGVGVDTAPQTIAVAIPHANRALWKQVMMRSPRSQTIPAAGLKVSFSHSSRFLDRQSLWCRRATTAHVDILGSARARAQQHRRACACARCLRGRARMQRCRRRSRPCVVGCPVAPVCQMSR